MVGKQALEIEFLKGALKSVPPPSKGAIHPSSPARRYLGAEGYMSSDRCPPRCTYYDAPPMKADDAEIHDFEVALALGDCLAEGVKPASRDQ